MDSEITQKNIEALTKQYFEKLECDWQNRKTEEVVDCHDALIMATQNYPRVVVLSALQLFNHELVYEIITEIIAQVKKRQQINASDKATVKEEIAQKEHPDKVEETLNPS